ncbi:MAG: carboxypeptidase-like regulatory domain-containing protein [Bacteroidota bacterium]
MKILLVFLVLLTSSYANQISLKGKIVDNATGVPLSFANIRIAGTTTGTAANLEGNFILHS